MPKFNNTYKEGDYSGPNVDERGCLGGLVGGEVEGGPGQEGGQGQGRPGHHCAQAEGAQACSTHKINIYFD